MKSLFAKILSLSAWITFCHGLSPEESVNIKEGHGSGWGGPHTPPVKTPGPCIDPSKIKVATNVDADFLGVTRQFYHSGGTAFGYGLYAQAFLGRNPNSVEELGEMCPTFFPSSTGTFVSGYGKMFKYNCEGEGTGFTCTRNLSPGVYNSQTDFSGAILAETTLYLVDTDNKYYVIFLACVNDQYADFLMWTTRPYVSPQAAAAFVKQIKAYNFPLDQALLLTCRIPNGYVNHYQYPFTHYPFSPSDYYNHGHNHSGNGWSST